MKNKDTCNLCKNKLSSDTIFKSSSSISSDMKNFNSKLNIYQCPKCLHIQKKLKKKYKNNINYIYNNYSLYHFSNGIEQPKFYENGNLTKSEILLNDNINLFKNKHSLLDFGCGNGSFLKIANKKLDNIKLYGLDITNKSENELLSINKFKKLFIKKIPKNKKFSLITSIHSLEHIFDPLGVVKEVYNHLEDDGIFLIQVPNINTNTFDSIIYDHVSHFTPNTLYKLLNKVFPFIYYPKKQISKEITMIASKSHIKGIICNDRICKKTIVNFEILNNLKKSIKRLNKKYKRISIFGAGVEGLYISELLGDTVHFILDEDINKIGKKLNGIPVISPSDYTQNENCIVIIPFNNKISKIIMNKFKHISFYNMINK